MRIGAPCFSRTHFPRRIHPSGTVTKLLFHQCPLRYSFHPGISQNYGFSQLHNRLILILICGRIHTLCSVILQNLTPKIHIRSGADYSSEGRSSVKSRQKNKSERFFRIIFLSCMCSHYYFRPCSRLQRQSGRVFNCFITYYQPVLWLYYI